MIDFARIVVAFNGSAEARVALERAAEIARLAKGTLHVVSVGVPVLPAGAFDWVPPYDEGSSLRATLDAGLRGVAAAAERACELFPHVSVGQPAREIAGVAEALGAGLVVLGVSRKSTAERILLGDTADRLLRISRIPILLATASLRGRRILAAADDSAFGERAILCALAFAALTGGSVRCLHVVGAPPAEACARHGLDLAEHRRRVEEGFAAFVARARRRAAERLPAPLPETDAALRSGEVVSEILREAAHWRADLIVAGTHGRGFVERALLGSVAEELVRATDRSLLVVPGQPG